MPRVSDAKQRLLTAALELVWEHSYGATTVDEICRRAGVKKGSFYYFFASKSELAVAAVEADWESKNEWRDRIFNSQVAPLDRLRRYFELVYQSQAEMAQACGYVLGCPLFSLGCEQCTQDSAIRTKVEEILERYTNHFEIVIREAMDQGDLMEADPRAKAEQLLAFFQGTLTQARICNRLEPLKHFGVHAMELLGTQSTSPKAA